MGAKVIVDYRESNSGIVKEFGRRDLDVEVKQLLVADFIIQTKDIDGNIVTVGIEKKTQNDFINSIIDRRITQQIMALKDNFSIPLLIIEGSDNIYTLRNFHPNAIRGMMASIAVDFRVPILHTKNFRDTAALIEVIARRLEQPRKPISLLSKPKPLTSKELQIYAIESLPGIGPNLAKSLLKEFKSIKNIVNYSIGDLKKVDKIGPKKANDLYNLFNLKFKED